jgi:hypothetical protein
MRGARGVARCGEAQADGAGNIASSMPPTGDENSDSGRVPVFGTWRAIYVSVIIANLIVMTLIYLFQRFPF